MSDILVELEGANRRCVSELQIVPRPARSDAFVVESLVVADYAAVDALDAGGAQCRDPLLDYGVVAIASAVDGWIPATAHEEIALEHSAFERRGCFECGREPM